MPGEGGGIIGTKFGVLGGGRPRMSVTERGMTHF